jgi:hypothetical protein
MARRKQVTNQYVLYKNDNIIKHEKGDFNYEVTDWYSYVVNDRLYVYLKKFNVNIVYSGGVLQVIYTYPRFNQLRSGICYGTDG